MWGIWRSLLEHVPNCISFFLTWPVIDKELSWTEIFLCLHRCIWHSRMDDNHRPSGLPHKGLSSLDCFRWLSHSFSDSPFVSDLFIIQHSLWSLHMMTLAVTVLVQDPLRKPTLIHYSTKMVFSIHQMVNLSAGLLRTGSIHEIGPLRIKSMIPLW